MILAPHFIKPQDRQLPPSGKQSSAHRLVLSVPHMISIIAGFAIALCSEILVQAPIVYCLTDSER